MVPMDNLERKACLKDLSWYSAAVLEKLFKPQDKVQLMPEGFSVHASILLYAYGQLILSLQICLCLLDKYPFHVHVYEQVCTK